MNNWLNVSGFKHMVRTCPEVLKECKAAGENHQKQCLFMDSSVFLLEK